MNLKELVDIYENIDTVSVKELCSAFVMYCKIVYHKHGDYDLEDIKNYCKYVYLLKQSEKLKNELSKLTSYGRNEQLLPALDVVNDIYNRIEKIEPKIEAFVSLDKESALKRAEMLQEKLDNALKE